MATDLHLPATLVGLMLQHGLSLLSIHGAAWSLLKSSASAATVAGAK